MKKVTRQRRPIDDAKLLKAIKAFKSAAAAAKAIGMDTAYGVAKVRARLESLVVDRKAVSTVPDSGKRPGRIPTLYRAR